MKPKKLSHIFDGTKKLPTPSSVALEVMRLCYSNDSSLQDIAQVVEIDPALSGELLKFANSAIMQSPMQVASVQRAAVKIGMKGLVNLALGFSMLSQYKNGDCKNFNYSNYWCHCLAQAVAARNLAKASKKLDLDEAFTCGLLSTVGELALATAFPKEYSLLLEEHKDLAAQLRAEKDLCSMDRHQLTEALLIDWGMPDHLAEAAGIHAAEKKITQDAKILWIAELLSLAGNIADTYLTETLPQCSFEEIEEQAEKYGIETENFSVFFDQFVNNLHVWAGLLQVQTKHCPDYLTIKELNKIFEKGSPPQERSEILILLVDNDPHSLLDLDRLLSCDTRKIITTSQVNKALQIAMEEIPDILITTKKMNDGSNGIDLCKKIRRLALLRHIYIIMLVDSDEDEELLKILEAGVDDCLSKPFIPKILYARIRNAERIIRYQRTIRQDKQIIQQSASWLTDANIKLQTMAMTDALTNLPNRRSAIEHLKNVIAQTVRFNDPLSCILIDIDRFKNINDEHGHNSGDLLLEQIATLFQNNARVYDMISRIGGEEFLVISTRTGPEEAVQFAERLRTSVAKQNFVLTNGKIKTTISLGVSIWKEEFKDGQDLFNAADRALYLAKHNGRNRVEVAWKNY